jgi:hypothetical protein
MSFTTACMTGASRSATASVVRVNTAVENSSRVYHTPQELRTSEAAALASTPARVHNTTSTEHMVLMTSA